MSDNLMWVLVLVVICAPSIIYALRGKKEDGGD